MEFRHSEQNHDGPEALAALGFETGRFLGAWRGADRGARELFGLALAQRMVVAALQAEGYAFTPERVAHWLAGAVRLDAEAPPLARPPRLVLDLVLGELAISRCEELAVGARLLTALAMPIADEGDHGVIEDCHAGLQAALAIALRARFSAGPGVVGLAFRIAAARDMARKSEVLATREAGSGAVSIRGRVHMVSRAVERAPNWTLDLAAGPLLAEAIAGMPPLPCPGLFDRAMLRAPLDEDAPAELAEIRRSEDEEHVLWSRVGRVFGDLGRLLDDAIGAYERALDAASRVSSKSRLSLAVGLLGICPELRSAQLERALGVSRIGMRWIVDAGIEAGWLGVRKKRGLRFVVIDKAPSPRPVSARGFAACVPEVRESGIEDALAFADGVLARYGGAGAGEDDEGDVDLDVDGDPDVPGWV